MPEDWTAEDGGALDLFSSENGKPTKVAKSICPSFNAFAFFEVSPASFHQVDILLIIKHREMLSSSKMALGLLFIQKCIVIHICKYVWREYVVVAILAITVL